MLWGHYFTVFYNLGGDLERNFEISMVRPVILVSYVGTHCAGSKVRDGPGLTAGKQPHVTNKSGWQLSLMCYWTRTLLGACVSYVARSLYDRTYRISPCKHAIRRLFQLDEIDAHNLNVRIMCWLPHCFICSQRDVGCLILLAIRLHAHGCE